MSRTHIYLSKEAADIVAGKDAEIARLRAELANSQHVIDEQRKAFGDTARQDAETIARLRRVNAELVQLLHR